MSSSLRSFSDAPGTGKQNFTRFHNLTTSSYFDSILGIYTPIPFTYKSGVLDINSDSNNAMADLIDSGYTPVPFSEYMVRQLGGKGMVTELGPNMVAYIQNFCGDIYGGPVTNLVVHTPGVVTKVQQPTIIPPQESFDGGATPVFGAFGQYGSASLSDTPPCGDDYIFLGADKDSYNAFWVFLQPLTLRFKVYGETHFLTFSSQFTKGLPFFLG